MTQESYTFLLSLADRFAAEAGLSGTSLIVADANEGARRLYTGHGFRAVATRPMIKQDWENPSENWIQMTKEL